MTSDSGGSPVALSMMLKVRAPHQAIPSPLPHTLLTVSISESVTYSDALPLTTVTCELVGFDELSFELNFPPNLVCEHSHLDSNTIAAI